MQSSPWCSGTILKYSKADMDKHNWCFYAFRPFICILTVNYTQWDIISWYYTHLFSGRNISVFGNHQVFDKGIYLSMFLNYAFRTGARQKNSKFIVQTILDVYQNIYNNEGLSIVHKLKTWKYSLKLER